MKNIFHYLQGQVICSQGKDSVKDIPEQPFSIRGVQLL